MVKQNIVHSYDNSMESSLSSENTLYNLISRAPTQALEPL